ncbi:MAG: hypothetical protein R2699_02035 [Acidimicrobiales bacterium]
MCMFSQPVERVARTRIFARAGEDDTQLLAYAMSVAAAGPVAMVLALPTPPDPAEDAVRFIDLSGYADLFDDLAAAFPRPQASRGAPAPAALGAALAVHAVGDFEASFVPTVRDFDRLDERFRLPDNVWRKLPELADRSFAVSQLRGDAEAPVDGDVHPMAFAFERHDPSTLFFPTVHVHDGSVPRRARFDHTLYWQAADLDDVSSGDAMVAPAAAVAAAVDADRSAGLVDPTLPCAALRLVGKRPNTDTTVPVG